MRLKMSVLFVACFVVFVVKATAQQQQVFHRGSEQRNAKFVKHVNTILDVKPIISENVENAMACAFKCLKYSRCVSYNMASVSDSDQKYECQLLSTDKYNSSDNLKSSKQFHHYSIKSPCDSSPCKNGATCRPVYEKDEYKCNCTAGFSGTDCRNVVRTSCGDALRNGIRNDGAYEVKINKEKFTVYCDMTTNNEAWTLIARFSNNDAKNWMNDNGGYWYDFQNSLGQTTNPADNADMISPAFWFVTGTEFKITRSDDSSHTALLHTTGDCLGGQTFRSKITSYGNFRNGQVWASDQCLGSCDVQYGGQYSSTNGFEQNSCDGEIQTRNKIGFWCDWSSGDGAVMMIGGGGSNCDRADHGIGITEAKKRLLKTLLGMDLTLDTIRKYRAPTLSTYGFDESQALLDT